MAAAGDQAPGEMVGQLGVLAVRKLGGVVRGEHVRDLRPLGQAHVRVGLDAFRAKPLHLGAALVALDDELPRLRARARGARGGTVLRRAVVHGRGGAPGAFALCCLLVLLSGSGNRHLDDPLRWTSLVKRSA